MEMMSIVLSLSLTRRGERRLTLGVYVYDVHELAAGLCIADDTVARHL